MSRSLYKHKKEKKEKEVSIDMSSILFHLTFATFFKRLIKNDYLPFIPFNIMIKPSSFNG